MDSAKIISGICPYCKNDTKFRELSFTENLTSVGEFVGDFIFSGLSKKVKQATTLIGDFSDSRSFPNYKCGSCGKEVMQCSACKEIVPYSQVGTDHVCGANKPSALEVPTSSSTEDVIAKIERLASLKERGLLTAEEFEQQKRKLLA